MSRRTTNKFSPEVRGRAVLSLGAKIGCAEQTLHEWVKKAVHHSDQQYYAAADIIDTAA